MAGGVRATSPGSCPGSRDPAALPSTSTRCSQRAGVAKTVLVLPAARPRGLGHACAAAAASSTLDGARGGQAHLWGSKHANRWAWVHCNDFAASTGEPRRGDFVDGVSVFVPRFGRELGPNTPVVGRFARARSSRSTGPLRGQPQPEPLRAELVATSRPATAPAQDRGDVDAPRDTLVGVTYHDPDGELAYCYNSEVASLRLQRLRARPGRAHRLAPGRDARRARPRALRVRQREPRRRPRAAGASERSQRAVPAAGEHIADRSPRRRACCSPPAAAACPPGRTRRSTSACSPRTTRPHVAREPRPRRGRGRRAARALRAGPPGPRGRRARASRAARPRRGARARRRPGHRRCRAWRRSCSWPTACRWRSPRPGAVAMLHAAGAAWPPAWSRRACAALRELGGRRRPVAAAIGPGAGRCCYEVGEEVHAAFADHGPTCATAATSTSRRSRGASSRPPASPTSTTSASARCARDPGCSSPTAATAASTGRQAGVAWRS